MQTVRLLEELPPNFHEFVEEVAVALGRLYGPAAADEYRMVAPSQFKHSLQHLGLWIVAADVNGETAGLLMSSRQGECSTIPFLHVLQRFEGQGVEKALVRQQIEWSLHGAQAIIAEFPPFGQLDVDDVFEEFQFRRVDRMIMARDSEGLCNAAADPTTPMTEADWRDAARILVEAYRDLPGRQLHLEVRSEKRAAAFINAVFQHGFGRFEPGFGRIARHNGVAGGMILGARLAPGTGFVLHVAVRPGCRNQGIGEALIRSLGGEFAKAGNDRIGLGVTLSNPAVRLYERLGFEPLLRFPAYTWWR